LHLFSPSPALGFEIVIGCWTSSRAPGAANQAEALLDQMQVFRVKANSKAYKYTIQALARKGEAARAEALLNRHVKDYSVQFDAELKPDLQAFQSVLTAYSRYHHPDAASKAESLLTHMQELYQSQTLDTQPNVWSYNTVISAWIHGRSRNAGEKAMRLYDEIQNVGLEPDTVSLNMLLHAYTISKSAPETEELFRMKLEAYLKAPFNNPQPDSTAFGTVLNSWAKSKSEEAPEKAESLLALLSELNQSGWEQCKPDVVAYASTIQCWANAKRKDGPQNAEALLRHLQQLANSGDAQMAPDSVCWNSVISAWARAGNGERAESLFKEMLTDYIRDKQCPAPTVITFTTLLSAWAKTQNNPKAPERAISILRNMERLHQSGALDVKPNVVHFTSVLDCIAYSKCRSGAEQAEQLLREMASSDDPDVQPNVISYNCAIKAWSFLRDEEALPRATALLKELLEKAKHDTNMIPNRNTFGGVLKTLADSNVHDKEKRARVIENLMERFGIHMNGWTRHQFRRCKPERSGAGRGNAPRKSAQRKLEQIPNIPAT
jgi:pentatricopeptide repeat protein